MAYITYAPGIDTVSGAMAKPAKKSGHIHGNYVIGTHRKAASENPHCLRFYIKAATTYDRTTPLKVKEGAARQRFQAVRAMVQARKEDLTKVTADQQAFLAQRDIANGKKTMNAYLWKVCGQEYDKSQD